MLCVCICVFMCVCTDVCRCVYMFACVCIRRPRSMANVFFSCHILYFMRQVFSLNLELTGLPRQSGWQALTIHLSLFPHHWGYRHAFALALTCFLMWVLCLELRYSCLISYQIYQIFVWWQGLYGHAILHHGLCFLWLICKRNFIKILWKH